MKHRKEDSQKKITFFLGFLDLKLANFGFAFLKKIGKAIQLTGKLVMQGFVSWGKWYSSIYIYIYVSVHKR